MNAFMNGREHPMNGSMNTCEHLMNGRERAVNAFMNTL